MEKAKNLPIKMVDKIPSKWTLLMVFILVVEQKLRD